jgi:hypothetical protein
MICCRCGAHERKNNFVTILICAKLRYNRNIRSYILKSKPIFRQA